MKIYANEIPPEGVELEEQIEPKKISLDLEPQGMGFTKSIEVRARIAKSGTEVFADVKLEAPVQYTCSRCLAKFPGVFNKTFNVSYEVKPGDVLDIDEDIRQEMMLDYSMKLLCKAECKGLCANCGQNLNVADCDCKK